MSEMQDYLDRHYCEAATIADRVGISLVELDELIDARLVPGPSYVVHLDKIISAAFGELPRGGAKPGRYFAPSERVWIRRARTCRARNEAEEVEAIFRTRISIALAAANREIFRLVDAFDDSGERLPGLDERLDEMWTAFLDGGYALCVVEADSEVRIVRKEILQEKLIALTDNGAKAACAELQADELSHLIDDYDAAAMPFAPAEYPRSSRKRLVDDLRVKSAH
jgi:hypothetical protein